MVEAEKEGSASIFAPVRFGYRAFTLIFRRHIERGPGFPNRLEATPLVGRRASHDAELGDFECRQVSEAVQAAGLASAGNSTFPGHDNEAQLLQSLQRGGQRGTACDSAFLHSGERGMDVAVIPARQLPAHRHVNPNICICNQAPCGAVNHAPINPHMRAERILCVLDLAHC